MIEDYYFFHRTIGGDLIFHAKVACKCPNDLEWYVLDEDIIFKESELLIVKDSFLCRHKEGWSLKTKKKVKTGRSWLKHYREDKFNF